MDVDENVSLSKPKAPAKPGQQPEDVSLTHKTPAEIIPTVRITLVQPICLPINFEVDANKNNLQYRRMKLKRNLRLRNQRLSKKKLLRGLHLRARKRRYRNG